MSRRSKRDPQVWLLSVIHIVNIIDYFSGHLLIHYKHENKVMSELTLLANKVTVAPYCIVSG